MKWHVRFGEKLHTIELQPRGQGWQTAILDGQSVWCRFDERHGILSIESGGVFRNLDIRSLSIQKQEQDASIKVEWWNDRHVRTLHAVAEVAAPGQEHRRSQAQSSGEKIKAPMTGKILQVLVKLGDKVTPGQTIAIIEAMKMENRINAQSSGVIEKISVKAGQNLTVGSEIARIKSE